MDYFKFNEEQMKQIKSLNDYEKNSLSEYATCNDMAIRKYIYSADDCLRGNFSVDIDKILHNTLYNRYVDKTQVFSFYKNDDITRRALHVQLVARISKIIGRALKLNTDLIEAIALGHDIGHTPFGHKGEKFLDELYYSNTGRHFNHNVHSVRSLMIMTNSNLTLQTYDGILCHCGEKAFAEYRPKKMKSFKEFLEVFELCYTEEGSIKKLRPSTLEGCVVRISDMIAYLAKDRQDAEKADLCRKSDFEKGGLLGDSNSEIIDKIIINIVKNSIDKPYLKLDSEVFDDICRIKDENDKKIYSNPAVDNIYFATVKPMMTKLYEKMKDDIVKNRFDRPIFRHHLNHPILGNCYRDYSTRRIIVSSDDIVTDYIASMTDDYFIDLFRHEFPKDKLIEGIRYISYFEK